MKFSANFLAICVFQTLSAEAFVAGPARTTSSTLYSSAPGPDGRMTTAPPMGGPQSGFDERVGGLERGAAPGSLGGPGGDYGADKVWDSATPIIVQGGSLKTWSFANPNVERIQVVLRTEGRPLDADVELWQGPDNTPHKMRVYVEDGALRPFNAILESPRGPNTISIRNTGHLEFPMAAVVAADTSGNPSPMMMAQSSNIIQGGALRTFPFDAQVDSVQVLLRTDGRPLNSRIELLQGPNNNKQVIEIYTEDGMDRPFFAIIETPGSGNVIRIVNTATVEFPLTASVEAHSLAQYDNGMDVVISGDDMMGGNRGSVNQW